MGAPVKRSLRSGSWTRPLIALSMVLAVALVAAPLGVGFSGGIHGQMAGVPGDFATDGCTSCHGDHQFGPNGRQVVSVIIEDENGLLSGPYDAEHVYTITITLDERNAPEAVNRAGFNLRVDAGQLGAVDGVSQVSDDGAEATHVGAGLAQWQVTWTAPAEGPAVFDLWVNDVDGSGAPDPEDHVYNLGFFLTDHDHAQPGAVEEHEVHVGVPLPQYWLGLIALAGMLFIMVFGFLYLKFASPHNADQGDR